MIRCLLACVLVSLVVGCATFEPQPLDVESAAAEIHTKTVHDVTVSVAILTDDQAQQVYGVDLAKVGLQAVWLRIDNRSERGHWLLVSALDPEYFAPDEAAVLFHAGHSDDDEARLTRHFRELAIPLKSSAGQVTEGYVLAPRHEGGRYLEVMLAGRRHVDGFGFAVKLPDGDFDYERLDPAHVYGDWERPDLSLEELRAELWALPCCVHDKSGEREGDPLNLVLIGNAEMVLASLSRAGWSFTHRLGPETIQRMMGAAISGGAYAVAPVSSLYLYGRPQEVALQRARNTIVQRNHLRLWLAPFRYEGTSVWVGQVSRDIDIKLTSPAAGFTTHVIDPNVDEAREHLLQSMMVAGTIERFAFAQGIPPVSGSDPRFNLSGDPYFTDGLRLVIELSGNDAIPPHQVEFLDWQQSADPTIEAQE